MKPLNERWNIKLFKSGERLKSCRVKLPFKGNSKAGKTSWSSIKENAECCAWDAVSPRTSAVWLLMRWKATELSGEAGMCIEISTGPGPEPTSFNSRVESDFRVEVALSQVPDQTSPELPSEKIYSMSLSQHSFFQRGTWKSYSSA